MAKEKKPKKPKKVKEKKEKKVQPKEPKMKSSAPRRFGAWALVFFMVFMIAFGVYKILRAPTETSIERAIETQMTNLDEDTLARTKAVSFAEQFVTDYFTYADGESYVSKISPYCAPGVNIISPSQQSRVTYVGTGKVEVDGRNVNVDVLCRVEYAAGDEEGSTIIQYANVRVPVSMDKKGNCAIVALPVYIGNANNPSNIQSSTTVISGDNNEEIETIRTTIENFFEVYYKGTSSELKYYVTKNYGTPVTTGLGIEVKKIDTQIKSNGDKWDAECQISIDNNGIEQYQHCFLEIVKGAEGRYYINKLYTIY